MGILRKIKNRLKIVAGGEAPRPAATYSTATPAPAPMAAPPPPPPRMSAEAAKAAIEADIKAEKILIYMKGTPKAPSCGFSAAVVDMFDQLGVPYATRDVVAEPAIRAGIKEITDWPTIPQVFVGHEFIGGCDITREMFENGELKAAVEQALQS